MRPIINVLVVVLLALAAVGFLLTVLFRMREVSWRARCENHLRQLGWLALREYEREHGTFPSAVLPQDQLAIEDRLSWLVSALPYVKKESVQEMLDLQRGWRSPENEEAVRTLIVPFLCAANPEAAAPGEPAFTHYVGMAGLGSDAILLPVAHPRAGLFGSRDRTTEKELRAGLAYTMAIIETTWEPGPWAAGGYPSVRGVDRGGQPYIGPGAQFGGSHPGGANAAFADGSVRFLTGAIDRRVFESLATLSDVEPPPE